MRQRIMPSAPVIAEARDWLGTPYQHQGACKGVGADCLGLVRGVYQALLPQRRVSVPAYRQWAQRGDGEVLWQAAQTYLLPRPLGGLSLAADFASGDIVLFRLRARLPARHLAIITGPDTMIHALAHMGVCEVGFTPAWQRYAVARFALPADETL